MIVRPAQLGDLNACYELDKSYLTEYVWQMQTHADGRAIEVRFDMIRLPRPMKVNYPRQPDELLDNWRQEQCFLVAVDENETLIGFLDMAAQAWHGAAWVRNLAVHKDYRRQGVGTRLYRAGHAWARDNGLPRIIAEAQTKNHPAIRFFQKQGLVYCGYNDRYYTNGDIALFFSLRP